jgi:hypothetical protein
MRVPVVVVVVVVVVRRRRRTGRGVVWHTKK